MLYVMHIIRIITCTKNKCGNRQGFFSRFESGLSYTSLYWSGGWDRFIAQDKYSVGGFYCE